MNMLDDYSETALQFVHAHGTWVIQLGLVWFFTWVTSFVLQRLLRRMGATSSQWTHDWKHALAGAMAAPLRLSVWVAGLAIAGDILHDQFKFQPLATLLGFQPAAQTLIVGWFFLRFIHRGSSVVAIKHPQLGGAQIDTLEKISTAIIAIAMAFLILPNFGISISGLLAFGGIGGIIVGLAAKDMLANFFGAAMLYFDRPFAIGDWVHLPEKDIQGKVEQIGWRQVIVRTFDKRLVFIPNSMFGNLILMNPGKMTHRRILENIGVRYQDIGKLPAIIEEIRAALTQNQALDQTAGIVVHMDKFSVYSVDMVVSAFTKSTEWPDFLAIKEKVLFGINDIISTHGAEIAFPTQVLHIERNAS